MNGSKYFFECIEELAKDWSRSLYPDSDSHIKDEYANMKIREFATYLWDKFEESRYNNG